MSVLFLMPEKNKEEWKMPKRKEMCSSVSIEPDAGIVMMSISELHDFKGHPLLHKLFCRKLCKNMIYYGKGYIGLKVIAWRKKSHMKRMKLIR